MPVDERTMRLIAALQADFGHRVYLWLNDCAAEKLPVYLVEGLRSFARSDELYAQGRTAPGAIVTKARAGQSYHNFGLAVDCVLTDSKGQPTWDFPPGGNPWRRVVTLARGRGLAWGGDWRGFKDYPHFQPLKPPLLRDCRKRWPTGYHGE